MTLKKNALRRDIEDDNVFMMTVHCETGRTVAQQTIDALRGKVVTDDIWQRATGIAQACIDRTCRELAAGGLPPESIDLARFYFGRGYDDRLREEYGTPLHERVQHHFTETSGSVLAYGRRAA